MTPRVSPQYPRDAVRLLVIDPFDHSLVDSEVRELPEFLHAGDLLVVNDAATLPASLHDAERGVEIRLAGRAAGARWRAVVFGAGDWRAPTEERPAPPALSVGTRLKFAAGLQADVTAVSEISPRLVELAFDREDPDDLITALYAAGRPIQYSYQDSELDLWDVQTMYGGRPWAVEMPSAGRPLTGAMLLELRRRGVQIAWITHAAGLSSTGDAVLDAALPLPERYEIPVATVTAIDAARAHGGRVIAVGTTVVRALEGSAAQHGGRVVAEQSETALKIRNGTHPVIVDGIITGMHDETETHFDILRAFATAAQLRRGWRYASDRGYRSHEFGDMALILTSESVCSIC